MSTLKSSFCIALLVLGSLVQDASSQTRTDLDPQLARLKIESNPDTISSLYYQIASSYRHMDRDSSIKYLRLFHESAKIDNNPYSEADAIYWIADWHYYSDLDSSLLYCDRYYQAALQLEDTAWIGYAHEFFGFIYIESGETEMALDQFRMALDFFQHVDNSYQIGACYNNMGYAITFGSDQSAGMSYFLEAMKVAESIQDTFLLADVCTNIAYYYDKLGEFASAIDYYKRSLDYEMTRMDSMALASTHVHLATMYLKKGNEREFPAHLNAAFGCIPRSYSSHDYVDFAIIMAELYLLLEKPDSALHFARRVEEELVRIPSPYMEAKHSSILGDISLAQGKHTDAVMHYNLSSSQLEGLNIYDDIATIQLKKAEALSALGLYQQAYHAQKQARTALDSLKYGKVATLLGKYEQEIQLEEEMEQRRLQMELANQRVENENLRIRDNLRIAIFVILLLLSLTATIIYFLNALRSKNADLEAKNELIAQQKSLLEKNVNSLKQSEKDLKELNATRDKFFSILAHDLKNPFNAVIGFSDHFLTNRKALETADILQIMKSMNTSARFGYSLLENLLEWARTQTGALSAVPVEMSVRDALKYQIPYFADMVSKKNIRIDIQAHSTSTVFADVNMVNTVLRNLLQNALKFSHAESMVTIHLHESRDELTTCIEDNGIGMEEKELQSLFSLESSVQMPGTEGEKGTGLGLILCREFIEMNQGKIWAESTRDQGSRFYFSLPLYQKTP